MSGWGSNKKGARNTEVADPREGEDEDVRKTISPAILGYKGRPPTTVLLVDIKDRMCVPTCVRLSGNIGLQPPLPLHDVGPFFTLNLVVRRNWDPDPGDDGRFDVTHSHLIRQSVRGGGSVFPRLGGILDELPVDHRQKKRTFLFLASFPLHSSGRRFPSFQRFI